METLQLSQLTLVQDGIVECKQTIVTEKLWMKSELNALKEAISARLTAELKEHEHAVNQRVSLLSTSARDSLSQLRLEIENSHNTLSKEITAAAKSWGEKSVIMDDVIEVTCNLVSL